MANMYFPQYLNGRQGIELHVGESILDHIRRVDGIEIDAECGGQGKCGKDIVRVDEGTKNLSGMTTAEIHLLQQGKLRSGYRLACQAIVTECSESISVYMPNYGMYSVLRDFVETGTQVDPSIHIEEGGVYSGADEFLGPYTGSVLGLAIDVGTTTIVMQLVDMKTGKSFWNPIAFKNPQTTYGNDVISRIEYTMKHANGLDEMHDVIVDGVNRALSELWTKIPERESQADTIYDVVVVGNSTMRNIFFRKSVRTLGILPFESMHTSEIIVRASDIGLNVNPNAAVYGPPLIGGHVGADCLADIIATGIYEQKDISMIVDIGTNGEVVVGNRDKILTASCAAGGAYEGYHISCGIGAIDGAITDFKIANGKTHYSTLGGKPPLGVCGSGVIDLLAELLKSGIMNSTARIQNPYVFADSISINQDDINQLITAKASLRTDQDLLVEYYGARMQDIKRIYLAGAFGNYINVENAIAIGLLPNTDKRKFVKLGNGALAGAIDMLISRQKRADVRIVIDKTEHMKPNEIEGNNFVYEVVDNMYFKKGA